MKYYRSHWYYFGAMYFVIIVYIMAFFNLEFSAIQTILIFSFLALLIHQVEEYAVPGGFPAILNVIVLGEKEVFDRYPLNANQAMVTNVFLAYPFYIIPFFFPSLIWLGIAQIMFGIFQFFFHGFLINIKLKSLYNPGLGSVVMLHIPIGIYYIWFVTSYNLATFGDFVFGMISTLIAAVLMIFLPLKILANKQSKYPFSKTEMDGFAKDKISEMINQ